MVTDRPGVALGIMTADCGPVLFADQTAGVIGAAHAGWRGALDGVLEATTAAMEQLGAKRQNMVAALGPCIRQPSYEVGDDFKQIFVVWIRPMASISNRRTGPATRCLIWRDLSSGVCSASASGPSRTRPSIPIRSRMAFSAIAAQSIAANEIMAVVSVVILAGQ